VGSRGLPHQSFMSVGMRSAHAASPLGRRQLSVSCLALIVLVTGFLTSSADGLVNHSRHFVDNQNPACHSSIQTSHLVRDVSTHKLPPCSACFLYNLLAHSLIPHCDQSFSTCASRRVDCEDSSPRFIQICPKNEDRAPPPVGSITS